MIDLKDISRLLKKDIKSSKSSECLTIFKELQKLGISPHEMKSTVKPSKKVPKSLLEFIGKGMSELFKADVIQTSLDKLSPKQSLESRSKSTDNPEAAISLNESAKTNPTEEKKKEDVITIEELNDSDDETSVTKKPKVLKKNNIMAKMRIARKVNKTLTSLNKNIKKKEKARKLMMKKLEKKTANADADVVHITEDSSDKAKKKKEQTNSKKVGKSKEKRKKIETTISLSENTEEEETTELPMKKTKNSRKLKK